MTLRTGGPTGWVTRPTAQVPVPTNSSARRRRTGTPPRPHPARPPRTPINIIPILMPTTATLTAPHYARRPACRHGMADPAAAHRFGHTLRPWAWAPAAFQPTRTVAGSRTPRPHTAPQAVTVVVLPRLATTLSHRGVVNAIIRPHRRLSPPTHPAEVAPLATVEVEAVALARPCQLTCPCKTVVPRAGTNGCRHPSRKCPKRGWPTSP